MLQFQSRLIVLIIIIALLLGGVAFLALYYLKPAPPAVNANLPASPAETPTEAKSAEEQLSEVKSKFGTTEFCDYLKTYSKEQYNECIMALVTRTRDKQYCSLITDTVMKKDCQK